MHDDHTDLLFLKKIFSTMQLQEQESTYLKVYSCLILKEQFCITVYNKHKYKLLIFLLNLFFDQVLVFSITKNIYYQYLTKFLWDLETLL